MKQVIGVYHIQHNRNQRHGGSQSREPLCQPYSTPSALLLQHLRMNQIMNRRIVLCYSPRVQYVIGAVMLLFCYNWYCCDTACR